MMVSNRNLLFQGLIFRFHVKLRGSTYCVDLHFGVAGTPGDCIAKGSKGEVNNGQSGKLNLTSHYLISFCVF